MIVDQARHSKADLIVMTTHGFGDFRRMLLGSTAAKVLHDSDCPVFTTAHAESVPAIIPPFRTVMCAVDCRPHSEAVIRWSGDFAKTVGAQLIVAHMVPVLPMGQWGYCDSDLAIPVRRDAEEKARALLEATGVQAELVVEYGPVVETTRALAKDRNADLIVVGRHEDSGMFGRLRDTAYSIIREAPCPVVSVGSLTRQSELPHPE
jgi:nucleotide-binding universal stress UspA family protein